MRVILCDVCERKIVNSPIVKMDISFEYPQNTEPTKDRVFVAVSGVAMLGGVYDNYYNRQSGHKLEMCIQCAQYTDKALKERKREEPSIKSIVHEVETEGDYADTSVALASNT